MFKIFWKDHWYNMDVKVDRRTGGMFLMRRAKGDFSGYPVPVMLVDQETLGL